MTAFRPRTPAALGLLALALATFSAPVLADTSMPMTMPMSDAPVARDPHLFASLLSAGGKPFRSTRFLAAVTAGAPGELAALGRRFGATEMSEFARVFDYAVARSSTPGAAAPPASIAATELPAALYRAGLDRGSFDIEHLFDRLFGSAVHDKVMVDVAKRYGGSGESVYHAVLTALLRDLVKPGVRDSQAPAAMTDMPMHGMSLPAASAPPAPQSSGSGTMSGMAMPGMSMPGMAMPGPAEPAKAAGATPPPGDDMSGMKMSTTSPPLRANALGVQSLYGMHAMAGMDAMSMRTMPAVTDVGVPMSREGSGTAWLPDSTTTFGHMVMHGDDMFMTHGAGFVRYSDTSTTRGGRTLNAPNWFMAMATHPLGASSQIGARAMLSGDVATVGGAGYPLLFQSGETFAGRALHDRQHPHDLVSELALTYSHQLSAGSSASLYAAYPGEPALGPPTYMHREIAYDMADSPLGHHWQDSTHITFGVVTAGLTSGSVKAEGSAFTGREPNQIRTNFDPARFDSYSGRLSWNLNARVATQVSYGFIKSPESLTPSIDRRRFTASVITNTPLGFGQFFTTSSVFGQNADSDGGPRSNAYLFEADYHRSAGSLYMRAEFVQKSGQELALDENGAAFARAPGVASVLFPIGAYSIGAVRDVRLPGTGTVAGIGLQLTANTRPAGLAAFYGPGAPLGVEAFLRFRPKAIR